MKGEADKYLEQTKKRIELLNEVQLHIAHQWMLTTNAQCTMHRVPRRKGKPRRRRKRMRSAAKSWKPEPRLRLMPGRLMPVDAGWLPLGMGNMGHCAHQLGPIC